MILRRILQRGALAVPAVAVIVVLVALVIRLAPGDPVDAALGERAAAADREQLRHALGLDRSAGAQLAEFVAHLAHGDLGSSLVTGAPVRAMIAERLPATIELAAVAVAMALLIATPLGIAAAARPRGIADRASLLLAIAAPALPSFSLGPLLLLTFAVDRSWFPVAGRSGWTSVVLPGLTLAIGMAAVLARHLRSALRVTLGEDFIRAARARGAPERMVLVKHGLLNATPSFLTILGLQVGGLLAGAIVTETIFAWPGLGRLLVQAIGSRDYPLVQGCALVVALTYVAVNLATDLAQIWLDPRLRGRA
jgi:peptide/nickel transport system permease protein